jgi:hypothetical protein
MADGSMAVDTIEAAIPPIPKRDISLTESLGLLKTVCVSRADAKIRTEADELDARGENVRSLHELLKAINSTTDKENGIDWTNKPELVSLLDTAKELGVNVPEDQLKFEADDKHRLTENVRMTLDALNLQNQRQYQRVTRLQQERTQVLQEVMGLLQRLRQIGQNINSMRRG